MAQTRSQSVPTPQTSSTPTDAETRLKSIEEHQTKTSTQMKELRKMILNISAIITKQPTYNLTPKELITSTNKTTNTTSSLFQNSSSHYAKLEFLRFDGEVSDRIFRAKQFFELDNTRKISKVCMDGIHFTGGHLMVQGFRTPLQKGNFVA